MIDGSQKATTLDISMWDEWTKDAPFTPSDLSFYDGKLSGVGGIASADTLFDQPGWWESLLNPFYGLPEKEVYVGTDGDDRINLDAVGYDHAYGGGGRDRIRGNDHDNILAGGQGNDVLNGQGGNDRLYGGDGDDLVIGDSGDDYLDGGAGDDYLQPGDGNDIVVGGPGNDMVSYYRSEGGVVASLMDPDRNQGDAKGDVFIGVENLEGSQFDDFLEGDDRNNLIAGNVGDDTIVAGGGDDIISVMSGKDTVFGGDGTDTALFGEVANYTIERDDHAGTIVWHVVGTSGPDWADLATDAWLYGVERLSFSDGTLLV